MSGGFSVQQALFTKVRNDSAVDALLARSLDDAAKAAVYDAVPDAAVFPYVTLGDVTEIPWDTDDSAGREATYTFHAWSRYQGRKEVKQVMDAIKAALHDKPLTVSGELVVLVLFDYSDVILDPDGRTWHGVTRFRVITTGT